MIDIQIVNEPIKYFEFDENRVEDGSELLFNGRVRFKENNIVIEGLEYEQYEGMAELELGKIAQLTCEKFPINELYCKHRVGRIGVGEISLHVVIFSKHRKEGLAAMNWFISELKKLVPIWKWAIMTDNSRVPSECEH